MISHEVYNEMFIALYGGGLLSGLLFGMLVGLIVGLHLGGKVTRGRL